MRETETQPMVVAEGDAGGLIKKRINMADILHNLTITLSSPMVMAFALGIIATQIRSNLKFPEEAYVILTIYLLFAIGFKGGYKISQSNFAEAWLPMVTAIGLGFLIPIWSFFILKKFGKFDSANAGALAAHYGSVSAVTFGEGLAFLDNLRVSHEGFLPAMLAVMEVPAILVGIFLAKVFLTHEKKAGQIKIDAQWGKVLHELVTGKSTLLLVGGIAIGMISGQKGYDQTASFFDAPFRGVLTLFLLEVGLVTGRRLGDIIKAGPFLVAFGIIMPILHGMLGVFLGHFIGLSLGGATIMGVLAASASYIAAPAAVRIALPEASPSVYLTASLALTFPFNVTLGLPLYYTFANYLFGGGAS